MIALKVLFRSTQTHSETEISSANLGVFNGFNFKITQIKTNKNTSIKKQLERECWKMPKPLLNERAIAIGL